MEIEKEVKTIKVSYACPKCNQGYLNLVGIASALANPPEYRHRCDNKDCNYEKVFIRTIYPYFKQIEV